jgi:hypothetical protein
MTIIWQTGGPRQTNAQREEILQAYLNRPADGIALAVSRGLSPDYAYKLAHARGLIPRERKHWANLRENFQ